MKAAISDIVTALSISLAGGITAILARVGQQGQRLRFWQIIYQLAAAMLAGFIVHNLCLGYQSTQPGTGLYMCAIAITGYASRPILVVVKRSAICLVKAIVREVQRK